MIEGFFKIMPRFLDQSGHFRCRARFGLIFSQPVSEVIQALDRRLSLPEALESKIKLFTIMAGEQQVTHRAGRITFGFQIAEGINVTQALRHLLSFDHEEFSMHPIADKRLPGRALLLRNLILVMWKDEVDPAGMYVKGFTQYVHRHGRAFDMPTRSAITQFGLPGGFPRFRRLP